jgi:hydroxyacylglutathione hydrolase
MTAAMTNDDDLVTSVLDRGLGNAAYLVNVGDGRALAVDASRDLRRLRREAEARGLSIVFAADTHLHADFLSGAVQLAATDGAQILASKRGARQFQHRPLEDGDEVDLGGLTLRAMMTLGHTDEHLAFILLDGSRQLGVFTGGSLIVGSAARVDLVAPERTEELAHAQYQSLQRLAQLPDQTAVWPTHGGGSFCSTATTKPGAVSTIGAERATNPLLAAPDEDVFVRMLLGTSGSFPPYFLRLGERNRRGPRVLSTDPVLQPMDPEAVAAAVVQGAEIIDVRPFPSFAKSHPAGALSIPIRPAFASWLGWLVADDRPLVILRESSQDPDEILWQSVKIGYENILGEIAGGIDAWKAGGLPTRSTTLIKADQVADVSVLDIRQTSEFQAGHLSAALHIELGDLAVMSPQLPNEPMVVMCGHGERAMSAASLLERTGHTQVSVLDGSPQHVADATGVTLHTGP